FLSIIQSLTCSTLFPYTTLFRSLYVRSFREDRVFEVILERVQRVAERKQSVPNFDRRALLYKLELTDGLAAIKQTSEEHFFTGRSEEHTSELQSRENLVCRLLLE